MSIYHIFANRSNVGDWLSARAIQALLAPVRVEELLCDDPFVPEALSTLANATSDDFIIIGGGGLFMDYFSPFWRGFDTIAERVPFFLWGVGCCDMKREASLPDRPLLESIVGRSRLCVVRDELTRAFLSRCNLGPPVPCPTVVAVAPRPPGRGLLHVDALDNVGQDVFDAMNRAASDFAARTGRPFRAINNLIQAGAEQGLAATLHHYATADLVLAGRLHGCIIGLAMGRKVLAVSGDRKVESFMEAAGLGPWVLGCDEIDKLAERLHALSAQPEPIDFLECARQGNRLVADQVRNMISGNSAD